LGVLFASLDHSLVVVNPKEQNRRGFVTRVARGGDD
jgi:hypothetical protein